MGIARVVVFSLLCLGPVHALLAQPPEVLEAGRRAAAAAYPALREAPLTASMLLHEVSTTALGCDLIDGLRLPAAIDAHRLVFPLDGAGFAVHVSADGSLAQPCDERFPNLGSGAQPVDRSGSDSDGDGLPDSADQCPQVAGISSAERPGCPQQSGTDRDGDGIDDGPDRCPDQAGPARADGCALLQDGDGDGVPDRFDICAADYGVSKADFARGCPADGSGRSTLRRGPRDLCLVSGEDIAISSSRSADAAVIARYDGRTAPAEDGAVVGRTAAMDWYQLAGGWVKAGDIGLAGACYNIPIVNAAVGGATGCLMRPRQEFANVREAPNGAQVGRIYAIESQEALGADYSGQWLFFRAGWVSRAVLELAGACDNLPILNPSAVASGVVHFCPPAYAGFLRPRIGIGRMNARVASTTITNRLRAQPDVASAQIGEIPPRTIIDAILDGPACNGSYVWWQVQVDGQVGWTVESDLNYNFYYLEPVENTGASGPSAANPYLRRPSAQELVASRERIHGANVAAVDTIRRLAVASPRALAWSALRSNLAVVAGTGEIALFSYPEFARMDSFRNWPPTPGATAIAFSPDERLLAIGQDDGGLTVIEPAANAGGHRKLDALAGPVRALAWSQAGTALAAVSGDDGLKLARRAGTLKVWDVEDDFRPKYHYSFPYPLSAVAFSADDRWLALAGESAGDQRAGLWIYALEAGELIMLKPLVFAGAGALLSAPPTPALGDFVISSGDSLYQISLANQSDIRFFHQAGAQLTRLAFRPEAQPGAEAMLALASRDRSGRAVLQLVNALSPDARRATLEFAAGAIAFSPDGTYLAAADRERDQVLILGVAGN